MALIQNMGRNFSIQYGSQAVYQFSIRFATQVSTTVIPITSYTSTIPTDLPTAGTIIIAGTTITLNANDVLSPQAVALKIKSFGVTGFNVAIDSFNPFIVKLQSTSYGPISKPTIALGTATNIVFYDINFAQGVACPNSNYPVQTITFGGTTVAGATTFTVDGVTVTVALTDTPAIVATKTAATTFASSATTSGEGWVGVASGNTVTLTGTIPGPVAGIIVSMGSITGVTCSNFVLPVQTFTFTGTTTAGGTSNIVVDGVNVSIGNGLTPTQVASAVVGTSLTGGTSGETWTPTNGGGTLPTVTITGTTAKLIAPVVISMGSITGVGCSADVLPVQNVVFVGSAVANGTTVTVDGKATTVATSDSPATVATKVAATSYASGTTSGEAWTTSRTNAIVTLTGTSVPANIAGVAVSMGTITGISTPAYAYVTTPGSNQATQTVAGSNQATVVNAGSITTNLDDIWVGGRTPLTLWTESSNVTYTVATSDGTPIEQQTGMLVYGSALSLTTVGGLTNAITLTQPTNYVRVSVSNVLPTSYVEVHLAR
jgi:flagellin